jgi:hypothetical protein
MTLLTHSNMLEKRSEVDTLVDSFCCMLVFLSVTERSAVYCAIHDDRWPVVLRCKETHLAREMCR